LAFGHPEREALMAAKKLSPISIRLDAELKGALQRIANDDDRTLSALITRILKQYVAQWDRTSKRGPKR
jgi:predicted transcriptional regulator